MSAPSAWAAVVPAAGSSTRMGFDKTWAPVAGRPALAQVVGRLAALGVAAVVVGVPAGREGETADRLQGCLPEGLAARLAVVAGGTSRQETVRRCLEALPPTARFVLVHDAARPFASAALFRRVMAAAEEVGAACAAVPVVDTVHRAGPDGWLAETVDRSGLWLAQTPQAFAREVLVAAHALGREATDDAGLCASAGFRVRLVPGERGNVKLTYPEDLEAARDLPWAVGQGYDVHRVAPGRPLILGGVRIPSPEGLVGHSDADVVCHALADAVLGGAGLGDIGRHFPPDDPAYRDADSVRLLRRTVDMALAAGWRPVQADCLILAERPRLAPYVEAMRARLGEALGVPAARVNVKAGTHEGLGALGRGEGIAAQAVVLLGRLGP